MKGRDGSLSDKEVMSGENFLYLIYTVLCGPIAIFIDGDQIEKYDSILTRRALRNLPRLHRAVFKENLSKLVAASKNARPLKINGLDKEGR